MILIRLHLFYYLSFRMKTPIFITVPIYQGHKTSILP